VVGLLGLGLGLGLRGSRRATMLAELQRAQGRAD